ETGALLHAPSEPELAGWKVRRTLLGILLLAAGALGAYLGFMGMTTEGSAGDGAVFVTLVTIGASFAIAYFGLRYLMLGINGKGVVFYEQAVEADFQHGLSVQPRRSTVPLLHIRLTGSERLTYGQAITVSGHAFKLPPSLVERSDPWYLGSLGRRPITPGGEEAKERYESGELTPYEHPVSEPLPDHGPAWTDPGTLPITVEVSDEPEPEPPAARAPSAPARPSVPPPVAVDLSPRGEPSVEREVPEPPAMTQAPEPEMEVVMDLPDVVPPPETPRMAIPPPPEYRPRDIRVPEPPEHREMERDDEIEPIAPPEPVQVTTPVPPAEPTPPPEPPPPPATVAPPAPRPSPSDEWELEELPPPEEKRKRPSPSPGGDWEEM
ncbi:MAG: hypothetical protein JSW25_05980, partial [Thermoplasmata archaeon]